MGKLNSIVCTSPSSERTSTHEATQKEELAKPVLHMVHVPNAAGDGIIAIAHDPGHKELCKPGTPAMTLDESELDKPKRCMKIILHAPSDSRQDPQSS